MKTVSKAIEKQESHDEKYELNRELYKPKIMLVPGECNGGVGARNTKQKESWW